MIEISALLPNPRGDDSLGEWIEVRNTGDEKATVEGWRIADKSGKTFVLKGYFNAGEARRFTAKETRISLNNTDEEIMLIDQEGKVAQRLTYAKAGEDEIIAAEDLLATLSIPPTASQGIAFVASGTAPYMGEVAIFGAQSLLGPFFVGIAAALFAGYTVSFVTRTIYAEERINNKER